MRVQVQKWGNSLALRIPRPFAEDAAVREGSVVDLSVSKGKLIAVPLNQERSSLKQLLARVTRANLHREIRSGRAVGRESW